jgi:DNA polymerase-3 subunit alpha
MFAAMELAGYTASEADDLRKAISKKKADAIIEHRQKFILGALGRGISEQIAGEIFTDWENFARYGFNKSHAADYGIIAVETAFLKTHFTVEYMTAQLSGSKNETEKVAYYVIDCRSMGIDVLPPDVNVSGYDFTIEDRPNDKPAIRFGLGAIKNVGQGPVDLILQARTKGPIKDIKDFARRVDLRQLGKRALECLIKVGALDAFGGRAALLQAMDNIISFSSSHFRSLLSGQLSFFGNIEGVEDEIALPKEAYLDRRDQLEWERELIGLYISDHPLSPYMPIISHKISHFSGQLGEVNNKDKVRVAGMVTRFRDHQTKTGKIMGFVTLEDIQGSIELLLFPKTWEKYGSLVEPDRVLFAGGKVDTEGNDPKILVDELEVVEISEFPEYEPEIDITFQINEPGIEVHETGAEGLLPAEELEQLNDGQASLFMIQESSSNLFNPSKEINPINNDIEIEIENWVGKPINDETTSKIHTSPPVSLAPLVPPTDPEILLQFSDEKPRVLTVLLRTTGDKVRDIRRMRRVHGLLRSSPGRDRFAFMLMEGDHQYQVDFPNDMIGISNELMHRLLEMVGPDNVWVV